jgi:hypothetical protein
MRGKLADAIRASHADDIVKMLQPYANRTEPNYIEKIRDKRLKDAERLARFVQKKNGRIIAAIDQVRELRKKQR